MSSNWVRSFSSIYCTVICDDDAAELVVRNR